MQTYPGRTETCQINVSSNGFFAMMLTGLTPQEMREDIIVVSTHKMKTKLQEFMGLATEMSPFVAKLTYHIVSIRLNRISPKSPG